MTISFNCKQSQQRNKPLRVAVSACQLGQRVRYDGKQKQHAFVCRQLQKWITLVPICPEVEIGMGVPRPPIQLLQMAGQLRAVGVDQADLDVTRQLNRFAQVTARQLSDIDGYIFKARSPSCGVTSTPIKLSHGGIKKGAGLMAAQIIKQWPMLPVVEEDKLETFAQQVNFIQRIVAYRCWRNFVAQAPSWSKLRQFHHVNRFVLMAHGVERLRHLDAWLAGQGKNGRISKADLESYAQQYMRQFSKQASRCRHEQVLRRIVRLLRSTLSAKQYASLVKMVDQYKQADRSLFAVISQLHKHQARACLAELEGQSYLDVDADIWRWVFKKQ